MIKFAIIRFSEIKKNALLPVIHIFRYYMTLIALTFWFHCLILCAFSVFQPLRLTRGLPVAPTSRIFWWLSQKCSTTNINKTMELHKNSIKHHCLTVACACCPLYVWTARNKWSPYTGISTNFTIKCSHVFLKSWWIDSLVCSLHWANPRPVREQNLL